MMVAHAVASLTAVRLSIALDFGSLRDVQKYKDPLYNDFPQIGVRPYGIVPSPHNLRKNVGVCYSVSFCGQQ